MYTKIIYILNSDPFVDDPTLLNAKEQGIYNGNIKAGEVKAASITSQVISITDENYSHAYGDIIGIKASTAISGGAITINVNEAGALNLKDASGANIEILPNGIHFIAYINDTTDYYEYVGFIANQHLRTTDDVVFNKVTANNMPRIATGNTLPTTGWVAYAGDYAYKYSFADVNVALADIVQVSIDVDDLNVASDAEIASAIDSYAGGFTFYANQVPASALTFDYVVMKG